jgi:hypothetical protein
VSDGSSKAPRSLAATGKGEPSAKADAPKTKKERRDQPVSAQQLHPLCGAAFIPLLHAICDTKKLRETRPMAAQMIPMAKRSAVKVKSEEFVKIPCLNEGIVKDSGLIRTASNGSISAF